MLSSRRTAPCGRRRGLACTPCPWEDTRLGRCRRNRGDLWRSGRRSSGFFPSAEDTASLPRVMTTRLRRAGAGFFSSGTASDAGAGSFCPSWRARRASTSSDFFRPLALMPPAFASSRSSEMGNDSNFSLIIPH